MNCADCGLENPPVQEACAFCEKILGVTPERRAEWEALGPKLREEFSANFERALQARRDWLAKLKRSRGRSALAGAGMNLFVMLLTQAPVSSGSGAGALLLLDVAAGAGLGFALNLFYGGEYRGMALFGAWFVLSTALKMGAGVMALGIAFGIFVGFGLVLALCAGYVFGLNLSMKRTVEF